MNILWELFFEKRIPIDPKRPSVWVSSVYTPERGWVKYERPLKRPEGNTENEML
jgi:hypothetical protein